MYYLPKPVSAADLALMRRIGEMHLERPFMGARMLRDPLHRGSLVCICFSTVRFYSYLIVAFYSLITPSIIIADVLTAS